MDNNWKYLECDFYEIFEYHEEKWIHIYGYTWYREGDEEHPYRTLEYSGFELPLKEYLSEDYDYDEWAGWKASAYIGDETEADALKSITDPFEGAPFSELPFGEITAETPIGFYVDYKG